MRFVFFVGFSKGAHFCFRFGELFVMSYENNNHKHRETVENLPKNKFTKQSGFFTYDNQTAVLVP